MMLYGKTWWGKRWLDIFTDIDEDNRLARGRRYASNGNVSYVNIERNIVKVSVYGSGFRPYRVQIKFKPLKVTEKKRLRKVIASSPSILASLTHRKLPPTFLEKLEQHKINLFPSSWNEIKAKCSCPDWAMPCKHIAALIYVLSAEIDKNPFTIFSIRDCDLLGLIEEAHNLKLKQIHKLVYIEDFFQSVEASDRSNFDQDILDEIDFSKIPDLLGHVLGILRPDPVFFAKDFREIIYKAYKHWQVYPYLEEKFNIHLEKNEEISEEDFFLEKWEHPEKWKRFNLVVDNDHHLTAILNGPRYIFKGDPNITLTFCKFLQEIPCSILHKLCPELRLLHMLFQFAVKLLEKSACVPQVLGNYRGLTIVRWVPALFNDEVKEVYEQLCKVCPANLVSYQKNGLSQEEQIKAAISIIVSGLMYSNLPRELNKDSGQGLFRLFFMHRVCRFADFADKEIPDAINSWLACLHVSKSKMKIFMVIEDKQEDFEIQLKVLLDGAPVSVYQALKSEDQAIKTNVLSDLALIFEYIPFFQDIIDNDDAALFTLDAFAPIFLDTLPILKAIGVDIILPKTLRALVKPRLNLNLKSKSKISLDRSHFLSLDDLLNFDWQIAIGDKKVPVEEFRNIAKTSRGMVRIFDEYVLLNEKEIEELLKNINKLPSELKNEELMQAAFGGELNGASVEMDNNLQALLDNINKVECVDTPGNLRANLRPYQERGFNWLIQNIKAGFGSILADDMGLGKTVQVIAAILHLKNHNLLQDEHKVLIVAPTSLLSNWQKEIDKFAPDLKVLIYHGQNRELKKQYDILITSYGLARRDIKELNKKKWLLCVIDEAQNIKNPNSQQTKAIKSVVAKHKIAMSGTPVENRLLEYWSIFDFTNKSYLGSQKHFKDRYAGPIEKERNKHCLGIFQKVTNPFILRRLKSDKSIIADLPDKITNERYCLLTTHQAALYQEVVDMSIDKIQDTEGIERKGLVLKMINALKQICNHPSQFNKNGKAAIDESGKMAMLEEILLEIDEVAEKSLIFTQYVEMGEIIASLLESRFKASVPFLHGGLSRKARDEMVNDFQNESNARTLIVSLKAGGTGLNLTAASHVIHYDLWWNPAVEDQATDRAYRIGQNRTVIVHRLLTTGTFEERIDEMLKSKKELANLVVGSQESWITEMNIDQIKDLVSLKM